MQIKNALLLACAAMLLVGKALADGIAGSLPSKTIQVLQTREQSLSHYSYQWKVAEETTVPPTSLLAAEKDQEQAAVFARKYANQQGITDPKRVDELIKQNQQIWSQVSKGSTTSFTELWEFTNDGDQLLVKGVNHTPSNQPSGYATSWQEYYGQNYGMLIPGSKTTDTFPAKHLHPNFFIWACSKACVRYGSPFEDGLNLSTADFSILTGRTPLLINNIRWTSVATTADSWILRGNTKQGRSAPATITLVLNRQYDGAPREIRVEGDRWSYDYKADHYSLFHDQWICDIASSQENRGFLIRKRNWLLQNTAVVGPLHLQPPVASIALDYRLLGENLNIADIQMAEEHDSKDVVPYTWKGQLPSQEELKSIRDKQSPGEASPDPKQTSSLPFVGGLMMLAGGVWMFRRRGSSS